MSGPTGSGRIHGLFSSGGGVPKLPLDHPLVDTGGIVGDAQTDLKHHGGPDRALCLYALERLLALREEGHPLDPGGMGENVLVTGLDWDLVVPQTRLRLGPDVLIEVTRYTPPCATIAHCFTGKQIARVLQDANPGWSRVYARVLEGGELKTGDGVDLL